MSSLIKELIEKDESDILDFKRDQYHFTKASNEEKSELLKDIIACSNALKPGEKAYIIVGVQEVKGGKNIVRGTDVHFDDANLQQFVNYKTNRKVDFSYQVHLFESKKIDVICISPPKFPIYINKDFGKLREKVIYYRSGSSTRRTTEPDEIARMAIERESLPKNIRLEYNPEEAKTISKQVVKRKAWLGYWIIAIGVLVTIVGLLVFNFLIMFPQWLSLLLLSIFSVLFYYLLNPYIEAIKLYNKRPRNNKRPRKTDEAVFIGKGKFMQIKDRKDYLIYYPTAKCTVPHCPGRITVVDAPPKEIPRLNKKYVGVCTCAGTDHSYFIDYNLLATLERFDWSQPKKQ